MDRLSEMEAFVAVVEHAGFTNAARHLGISKSAVSKHVTSLEARLGTRLLERTTRRVMPTDLGLLYYERARSVLAAASDAELFLSDRQREPQGMLRVQITDHVAQRHIAGGLIAFLAEHPMLSLEIMHIVPTGAAPADLILKTQSNGASPAEAPGAQSETLADIDFVLLASPEYLDEMGVPARIEDLAGHSLLLVVADDSPAGLNLIGRDGTRRAVHAAARLRTGAVGEVVAAVHAGLGIACLPHFVVEEDVESGRLVPVLTDLPRQRARIRMFCVGLDRTHPNVRAFADHFRTEGAGGPLKD